RFRGGFGGVVFGNTVTARAALPRLAAMTWMPAPDHSNTGSLQFQFRDASIREYGPIFSEDAYAAYAIAFGGSLTDGDGVGLVGVQNEAIQYEVGKAGVEPKGA